MHTHYSSHPEFVEGDGWQAFGLDCRRVNLVAAFRSCFDWLSMNGNYEALQ